MPNRFASGKYSIAICDNCGFQFKLKKLRSQVVKTKQINDKVCPECWSPDHPQLQLGMYPVEDPQAVRQPRRDTTYVTSGLNVDGFPSGRCLITRRPTLLCIGACAGFRMLVMA